MSYLGELHLREVAKTSSKKFAPNQVCIWRLVLFFILSLTYRVLQIHVGLTAYARSDPIILHH